MGWRRGKGKGRAVLRRGKRGRSKFLTFFKERPDALKLTEDLLVDW